MKTLLNMLLPLSLSAPLFASTITPTPEKLTGNKNLQDISIIRQTAAATVATTTPLIADATANTTRPESKAEESATPPPLTAEGRPIEEITVTGQAEEYKGGQVTRSGRLGLLGNQDIFDTPFSMSGYTSGLIENQRARTVGDVIRNDASARSGSGQGIREDIGIRGFSASANLYDGLPGLHFVSGGSTVQTLDGVEVFKETLIKSEFPAVQGRTAKINDASH